MAYVRETREVSGPSTAGPVATNTDWYAQFTVARLVWFLAGLLESLLAIRFILALLGANPSNPFASLIYSITYPFVAPFFTLFNYNYHYGVSMFESYTLVAMLVYGLIAYLIVRLIALALPPSVDVDA